MSTPDRAFLDELFAQEERLVFDGFDEAVAWLIGPMPWARPSGLVCVRSSMPVSAARRSRKAIISRNFQPLSTCSSGIGGRAG